MEVIVTRRTGEDELQHWGIKGQKWGVRRYQNTDGSLTAQGKKRYSGDNSSKGYRSTSIRSALARRSNEKVDKGFTDWKENSKKKEDAIALGKKANVARIAYEKDKSNKDLKIEYKTTNKEYKKALKENTTYRKGVIKQEVGRDASRKYLSEAKKVKKQLDKNPGDKNLQKQYDKLMSAHDVERAKARRAVDIATKRMRKVASIKRGMTLGAKAAAGTAATAAGLYAVNRYMDSHQVTLNGQQVRFSAQNVNNVVGAAKKVKDLLGYFV